MLDEPSKIVAPVVVIGSLIVGMLLALLVYRRRSQSEYQHTDTHIFGYLQFLLIEKMTHILGQT